MLIAVHSPFSYLHMSCFHIFICHVFVFIFRLKVQRMAYDYDKLTEGQERLLKLLMNEGETRVAFMMWSKLCFSNTHERFISAVEESQSRKASSIRKAKKVGNNELMSKLCDWSRISPNLHDNLDKILDSKVDVKFMNRLPNNFIDAYSMILEQMNRLSCRFIKMAFNQAAFAEIVNGDCTFDVYFQTKADKIKSKNAGKWTLHEILEQQVRVEDFRMKHNWSKYGEYVTKDQDKDLFRHENIDDYTRRAIRGIKTYERLMKYVVIQYVCIVFRHTSFDSVCLHIPFICLLYVSYTLHLTLLIFKYPSYVYFMSLFLTANDRFKTARSGGNSNSNDNKSSSNRISQLDGAFSVSGSDSEFSELEDNIIEDFNVLNENRVRMAHEQDVKEQEQFNQAIANIDAAAPDSFDANNVGNGIEELNNLTAAEMASMFDDTVSING